MSRRAPIHRGGSPARVLRHVRGHAHSAQVLHEASGIVGLVGANRQGPINPSDPPTRLHWMEEELRWEWEWVHAEEEAFWKEALAEDIRRVVWMSRRSAPEYCGFLEWLWRLGGAPCEVIDLTDMPVGSRRRAFSLSLLKAEEIASDRLWDRAEPLDVAARERHHSLWRRLRAENAPLRVVHADGLRSAPITFFDQQLLSFAKASWQSLRG